MINALQTLIIIKIKKWIKDKPYNIIANIYTKVICNIKEFSVNYFLNYWLNIK